MTGGETASERAQRALDDAAAKLEQASDELAAARHLVLVMRAEAEERRVPADEWDVRLNFGDSDDPATGLIEGIGSMLRVALGRLDDPGTGERERDGIWALLHDVEMELSSRLDVPHVYRVS